MFEQGHELSRDEVLEHIYTYPDSYDNVVSERDIDERSEMATARYDVSLPGSQDSITIDGYGRMYNEIGQVERDSSGYAIHFSQSPMFSVDRGFAEDARYSFQEQAPPLSQEHEREIRLEPNQELTPTFMLGKLTDERGSFSIDTIGTDGFNRSGPYVNEERIDEHSLKATSRYELRGEDGPAITVDGYGRAYDEHGDVMRDESGFALHYGTVSPELGWQSIYGNDHSAPNIGVEFKDYAPPLNPAHGVDRELEPHSTVEINQYSSYSASTEDRPILTNEDRSFTIEARGDMPASYDAGGWTYRDDRAGVDESRIDEHDDKATARYEIEGRDFDHSVTIDGYGRMYDEHGEVVRDEEGHALHFGAVTPFADPYIAANSNVEFREYAPPLTPDHQKDPNVEREDPSVPQAEKVYDARGREIEVPRDDENSRSHTFRSHDEDRSSSLWSRISSGIGGLFNRGDHNEDRDTDRSNDKDEKEYNVQAEPSLEERLEANAREVMERIYGNMPEPEAPEIPEPTPEPEHEMGAPEHEPEMMPGM